jgi:hypothetical protein
MFRIAYYIKKGIQKVIPKPGMSKANEGIGKHFFI